MPFPELQSFWESRIIAFFSLYEFSLFTFLCFVRAMLSYWYGERKMDIWIGKEKYTDWNLEDFFCPLPSLIPPTLMVSSGFIFPLCMFSLFLSPLMSIIILYNQYGEVKEMIDLWEYQKKMWGTLKWIKMITGYLQQKTMCWGVCTFHCVWTVFQLSKLQITLSNANNYFPFANEFCPEQGQLISLLLTEKPLYLFVSSFQHSC